MEELQLESYIRRNFELIKLREFLLSLFTLMDFVFKEIEEKPKENEAQFVRKIGVIFWRAGPL